MEAARPQLQVRSQTDGDSSVAGDVSEEAESSILDLSPIHWPPLGSVADPPRSPGSPSSLSVRAENRLSNALDSASAEDADALGLDDSPSGTNPSHRSSLPDLTLSPVSLPFGDSVRSAQDFGPHSAEPVLASGSTAHSGAVGAVSADAGISDVDGTQPQQRAWWK